MRIGLLHRGDPPALAGGLRALGHDVTVLSAASPAGLAESVLQGRGFTPGLTQLPALALALSRHRLDVVHAFAPDLAALAVRRARRTPHTVVLTLGEALDRSSVADRRLRLRLLSEGVEGADAIIVPGEREADALRRWMALDATVLAPDDAEAHEVLYGSRSRMRRAGTPA